MSPTDITLFVLGILCIVEFIAIIYLFKRYESLFEEIVQVREPGLNLPKYRNEMHKMVKEDREQKEKRRKSEEFLNLMKTGECSDYDVKKFGVEDA